MPRKHPRVRVVGERNLYTVGEVYWACATPRGSRQAKWLKLGAVGIMEARRRRDEFVARVRSGDVPAVSSHVKVRTVVELYLTHCEELVEIGALAPRTLDSYRNGLQHHFLPDYGNRAMSALSADDLVRWHRAQQGAGAAAWTIRNRWTAIRGLLAYATRHQLVDRNPAELLTRRERPGPGKSRARFLNEDQMRALLAATPRRFHAAVATMLFTGLRAGEVLGLVWADVDFVARSVAVRHQMDRHGRLVKLKSAAGTREVIMIPRLASILRAHFDTTRWHQSNDLVFTSTLGTSMTYHRLSQAMRRATRKAGLEGVSAHVLRHTFASILIYQGRDAVFVSRQLGHTTPSTTWDTYAHLFNAARQADEARDQLDAEFGSVLEVRSKRATAEEPSGDGEHGVSERLAQLRERGGLTGQDIARHLGATEQTVSRWQTGKGVPHRALGARLEELERLVDDLAGSLRPYEVRAAVAALGEHRIGPPALRTGRSRPR